MFNNSDLSFEAWASLDQPFVVSDYSTGIYQCYCSSLSSKALKNSQTCSYYIQDLYGGTSLWINMSLGIFIGGTNFMATKLIGGLIPRFGCQNL
jgi:hypothetical protein